MSFRFGLGRKGSMFHSLSSRWHTKVFCISLFEAKRGHHMEKVDRNPDSVISKAKYAHPGIGVSMDDHLCREGSGGQEVAFINFDINYYTHYQRVVNMLLICCLNYDHIYDNWNKCSLVLIIKTWTHDPSYGPCFSP